ncbi:NAD(P)-binding domain-containing protein [Paenibacillus contaminans]|uniref:Tartronate semialdehyde reductase n=1 Tax=Paenibacillus contaminans TaxID=450362 RepID=A0A329MNL1_9BACL|nr:tartronate semialdehyde reductase [Paenibacillus contaminans]
MKTIGFIGLGTMGKPMAINLLKNGYNVTVYNRSPEKMDELALLGADTSSSPADLARSVEVLFTNVSNDQALLDVIYGASGVLEGTHPGLTVIDCSTVAPQTSRRIHEELASHMVDFLDAPVTGSKPAAEAGTLVFMIGGNAEVFEENRDLFDALGSKMLYMGPSGSGSSSKLAHNTMVGINAAGLAEGLSIAVKSGLDPEMFLEIVLAGSANSKQAELKGSKIIGRDFSNQFSLQLMLKDLLLASQLTQQFQLPSPMLNSAAALFQMGLAKGLGPQDLCSVVQCYEDWMQEKIEPKQADEPSGDDESAAAPDTKERRRNTRISLNIKLQLSVYQWEQEGSFSGQNIEGNLVDLSESGLQIVSRFPLARDMFIVIHFPKEADLPPITGKIIRIESKNNEFRYGCMMSGLPPYIRIKLEDYIKQHSSEQA